MTSDEQQTDAPPPLPKGCRASPEFDRLCFTQGGRLQTREHASGSRFYYPFDLIDLACMQAYGFQKRTMQQAASAMILVYAKTAGLKVTISNGEDQQPCDSK